MADLSKTKVLTPHQGPSEVYHPSSLKHNSQGTVESSFREPHQSLTGIPLWVLSTTLITFIFP